MALPRIKVVLLHFSNISDLLRHIIIGGLVDVLYQVLVTEIIFVCLFMLSLQHLVLLKLIFGLITCLDHVGQHIAIQNLAQVVSNLCSLLY